MTNESVRKPNPEEEELGQVLWDYMNIGCSNPDRADAILTLGSIDTAPAVHAAHLYNRGLAPYLVFSGGVGGRNFNGNLPGYTEGLSEAQVLDAVAFDSLNHKVSLIDYNLTRDELLPVRGRIIEGASKNSGENITFTKKKLDEWGVPLDRLIVSHMPSCLRRDLATLKKQWPGNQPEFVMSGPNVPFSNYHIAGYQGSFDRNKIISDLLGDVQRLYTDHDRGGEGYIQFEEIPSNIVDAWNSLTDRFEAKGYDLTGDLRCGNSNIVRVEYS